LTLIADISSSSQVLATAFSVFAKENIQVEMMSQGASKVNISFIVKSDDLERAILQLHSCFFEGKCIVEPTTSSSDTMVTSDDLVFSEPKVSDGPLVTPKEE